MTRGHGNRVPEEQSLALQRLCHLPLKSHPYEVITNCSPEHLPKIALTSGCCKKDSSLWNRKEHLTCVTQHFCFCVAGASWGGRKPPVGNVRVFWEQLICWFHGCFPFAIAGPSKGSRNPATHSNAAWLFSLSWVQKNKISLV